MRRFWGAACILAILPAVTLPATVAAALPDSGPLGHSGRALVPVFSAPPGACPSEVCELGEGPATDPAALAAMPIAGAFGVAPAAVGQRDAPFAVARSAAIFTGRRNE